MDEKEQLAIEIAQKYLGRPLQDGERQLLLEFLRNNPGMDLQDVLARLASGRRNPFSTAKSEGDNRDLLEKIRGGRILD